MRANPHVPKELAVEELKRTLGSSAPSSASDVIKEADRPTEESEGERCSRVVPASLLPGFGALFTSVEHLDEEAKTEKDRIAKAKADARLLFEVQRCFLWLKAADVKAYDPMPLIRACECLSLSFPVMHQNDAAEFCDSLVSHLEKRLKVTPQKNALDRVFGGRLVSQTIRESGYNTEKEAPFTFLEVAIKNKASLEQALRSQMEGEVRTAVRDFALSCVTVLTVVAADGGRQHGVL